MLYEYPYTDLYNLNLDWMIKAIKQMQAIVEPLSIIVNTFNGRHGNVELTQDDVNAVMVDVLWISAPGDTIDDLPQASLDSIYRIGRRIMIFINNLNVPDTIYFLKWQSGHARPQLYSPTAALAGVASFNGQTGNVTATGSDLDTSDSDSTSIADTLSAQSQQISNLGPYNDLDSNSTTAALSAAQGKVLNNKIPVFQRIPISPSSAIASINSFDIFKYGDVYNIVMDFTVGATNIPAYGVIGSYDANGILPRHTVVLANIMQDFTAGTTIRGVFTLSYQESIVKTDQVLTANHRYIISAISI